MFEESDVFNINLKKENTKEKTLDRQLLQNEIKLQTERDLPAMDYVKTLELIRDVVTWLRDKHHSLPDEFYRHYDLVLSEMEPALDDLTLDSLSLVIEQYKDIVEIEGGLKFSEHHKLKNNINRRHEQFQKVITSRKM